VVGPPGVTGCVLQVINTWESPPPQSSLIRKTSVGSAATNAKFRKFVALGTLNVAFSLASKVIFVPFMRAAVRCTVPESLSTKTVISASFAASKSVGPEGGGPGVTGSDPGCGASLQAKEIFSNYQLLLSIYQIINTNPPK
jgi:hypothetical protein